MHHQVCCCHGDRNFFPTFSIEQMQKYKQKLLTRNVHVVDVMCKINVSVWCLEVCGKRRFSTFETDVFNYIPQESINWPLHIPLNYTAMQKPLNIVFEGKHSI